MQQTSQLKSYAVNRFKTSRFFDLIKQHDAGLHDLMGMIGVKVVARDHGICAIQTDVLIVIAPEQLMQYTLSKCSVTVTQLFKAKALKQCA